MRQITEAIYRHGVLKPTGTLGLREDQRVWVIVDLENLSDDENARLWAEEAERRDQAWDVDPTTRRPAADIFRDARARWIGRS